MLLFITGMVGRHGSGSSEATAPLAATRYRTIIFLSSLVFKLVSMVRGDPICFPSSFTALQTLL